MSSVNVWDDRQFQKTLQAYLDIRKNVDPKKELKRRAKNVGIRLIKIYKEKGVVLNEITAKVKSLGFRVRIRSKLRALLGNTYQTKKGKTKSFGLGRIIKKETAARRSAKGFTSTGWFPAVEKLGGNPKRQVRAGTGPKRGTLIEMLSGSNLSETLVNQQPGAGVVLDKAKTPIQQALDEETADMVVDIIRKLNEAAPRWFP